MRKPVLAVAELQQLRPAQLRDALIELVAERHSDGLSAVAIRDQLIAQPERCLQHAGCSPSGCA